MVASDRKRGDTRRAIDRGGDNMRSRTAFLAAMLAMAPLGARAADLVVWWDEGYYPQEDEAVKEIIAAFEQESGKQVELVFRPGDEHPEAIDAALEAGQPPDFAVGYFLDYHIGPWAFDDRLADLSDAIGHFANMFDPDVFGWTVWRNASTGQKGMYGLPMGRTTYHIHVWKSLLEQAGLTLEDIPKEWEAFWGFVVRRGAAAGAQGARSRRHLGRRLVDGGGGGHPERVLPVPGR
jgi:multiple sugar transport system substrate-binding protein